MASPERMNPGSKSVWEQFCLESAIPTWQDFEELTRVWNEMPVRSQRVLVFVLGQVQSFEGG